MSQTADQRVRFACEQCDQLLSIGTSRIGRTIKCPKCETPNEVPDEETAAAQLAQRQERKEARRQQSDEDLSQFEVFDDETEFIVEQESDGGYYYDRQVDQSKVAVPRSILYVQGGLLGFVSLAAFAFGWFVGASTTSPTTANVDDNTPRVIRGTLTFKDDTNRDQPDAGSVVIMLPQDSRPAAGEKVDALGLRPDDPEPDPGTHPGLQQISVLGGAYTRTNADGEFRVQLPRRGTYFLLIISGNTVRSGGEDLDKEHLAQMGRYFVPATELIGQNRFRWSEERVGRDMRLDHLFEKS